MPPDFLAIAFGLGSIAALWIAKQRWPRFPAAMVVVGACAAISAAIGYALRGGAVVGTLPSGLPSFYWPGTLPLGTFGALLLPALMITLVSFLETASSAKVDNARAGKLWNENQDLIGQGLAKIASGFSGAFPTSSSFSRSAINLYAGAQTGWATVFCVLLIGAALLWAMPLLYHVPQAVLAAIVVIATLGLMRPGTVRRAVAHLARGGGHRAGHLRAHDRHRAVDLLGRARRPPDEPLPLHVPAPASAHHRSGPAPDGSLRDRHLWNLPPLAPQLHAMRMDAELDFATASTLERAITVTLAMRPELTDVCLFAQPINRIDVTGAEVFGAIRRLLESKGVRLHLSGLKLPAQQVLERAGLLAPGPLLFIYRTDADALAALADASAGEARLSPAPAPASS